jgi:hypothetical protein
MSEKVKEVVKAIARHTFEGCVQTLVGGFTTFNVNASKKEVEAYTRMVEGYSIDQMNEAVLPFGLKVKVRKNLNYMKLPLEAQKKVDEVDRAIGDDNCYELSDGTFLEIGRYIKTPTSKKPSFVPFKKKGNKN